ncbi:MAG: hypothetical protein Sapg2KO_30850 [Saprospiraceae bacterium]
MKSTFAYLLFLGAFCFACQPESSIPNTDFNSNWQLQPELVRNYAGAAFWLNPLQAWEQKNGKLQVVVPGGDRNCVLLTHRLDTNQAAFTMQVELELLAGQSEVEEATGASDQGVTDGNPQGDLQENAWVGFQVGLQGEFQDYRDDAIHGRGLSLGITRQGQLFIGFQDTNETISIPNWKTGTLSMNAAPLNEGVFNVVLSFQEAGEEKVKLEKEVHASWLVGAVALTCSQSFPKSIDHTQERPTFQDTPNLGKRAGGTTLATFSNWKISGPKVEVNLERAYGPILWTQYTLSENILKMSAQMMPLGNDLRSVELWVDNQLKATAIAEAPGNNALFRIENWESSNDQEYVVRYLDSSGQKHEYSGTIVANKKVNQLKIASLSCVDDVGFPHQDLVDNVASQQPDLLVFHGDQLYERVGGYGVERKSKLDYLRKWYVFGWSFRDLYKNRPVVIIPDDHDVFHGNLWGEGGKLANIDLGYGYASQDDGGYKERPDFVNMVHRTQTGHLPDPADPTPVLNDISVYYTNMNYRGVSFAILGDRQWKSAPKQFFPNAEIEIGWPQNRSWNPKTDAFHPDAELLGARQEAFLESWVEDWTEETYMKAVISQSPFCNVATLPADIYHDKYVPGLPKYKKDEYPEDDRPVADFDSNGWPQNKRNKALRTIRKAFALHFTGDQHLGSTGRYGIEEHDDAGYWISSPAVSNLWPRRWYPAAFGLDGEPNNAPRYTGKYEDGFGNKITVRAIANPYDIDREPGRIFDKAPGYSIISINIPKRELELAAWPRWSGASGQAYKGWPITIQQTENYGKSRAGFLPEIEVDGETLVKVYNEKNNELLYILKPKSSVFKPFVFDDSSTYRIEQEGLNSKVTKMEGLTID